MCVTYNRFISIKFYIFSERYCYSPLKNSWQLVNETQLLLEIFLFGNAQVTLKLNIKINVLNDKIVGLSN